MAKSTIKTKLVNRGYPTDSKNYREAHAEADNAERKRYPKAYKDMKRVDSKLSRNELSGKNTRSGKIEISKKVPKRDRADVALHERTEHKALKRLAKDHKRR